MAAASDRPVGGIKGFLTKAVQSFSTGGALATQWGYWLAQKAGHIGIIVASTSMVIFLPLIFEINREVQMIAAERVQVAELRNQGMSDRQLQEMGFLEAALHKPAVAALKK